MAMMIFISEMLSDKLKTRVTFITKLKNLPLAFEN